ncbi:transcriptional regulator, HxlR family [Succinivibrio dextrinosolvens DSM 3072]|uniref:Transcriptional regulator, HxlR family n=1 Tax=Succinivibrio dextrinosolvens DSM 3072 TaxID=1123324 RepID=A0A1T4VVL0_9GAMM|nr:helix-turn-helix domain-containing protein [Succinivibrio dextrinosolvens]MBE6421845.1 helix-turn-helix transcriptional regulator [Succinivibrio dextrinosolvens]SKA68858.1 transcriptional regulator, HxlR family [Succinivibrio dextrinosolvens DSM 3072]
MTTEGKCCKEFLYKGKKYLCSLELAMDVIGGKWKSLLIFHLRNGAMRSSALQHSLTGISNKMFTQSIRELEADGIVKREIFPVIPPKVEYSLTEKGKTLVPIMENLAKWGTSICDNKTKKKDICDSENT